jgi:hypothetical protein
MSDVANLPRVGMIATVRNRRGLVVSVDAFDAKPEGRLHLVRVEYTDGDGAQEDTILWERERRRSLLEPTAMRAAARAMPSSILPRTTSPSALTENRYFVLAAIQRVPSPAAIDDAVHVEMERQPSACASRCAAPR